MVAAGFSKSLLSVAARGYPELASRECGWRNRKQRNRPFRINVPDY